jgi:hypothetical protein
MPAPIDSGPVRFELAPKKLAVDRRPAVAVSPPGRVPVVTIWDLVVGLMAVFGLPLVAVGAILRLCEWSWPKPFGSLGSVRFLTAGGLLCLPLLVYWGRLIVQAVFR